MKQTEMKFIIDRMYQRIARWLRMLGYDTISDPEFTDYEILKLAKKDGRILITRDENLAHKAEKAGIKAVNIDAELAEERLAKLAYNIGLELKFNENKLPRCTLCNSELKVVDKNTIKDQIEAGTFENYDLFWQCTNEKCNQIYWKGSHWENLELSLVKSNEILAELKKK